MRAARTHAPYVIGVALFAVAIVLPLPAPVPGVLAVTGLFLLGMEAVLDLRRPVDDPTAKPAGPTVIRRYARALCTACVVVAVLGAAYLWAAAFGDALHGLKDTAGLDNSDYFPDANVAYIVALLAYAAGTLEAAKLREIRGNRQLVWLVAVAAAGGAVFGVSRLFL